MPRPHPRRRLAAPGKAEVFQQHRQRDGEAVIDRGVLDILRRDARFLERARAGPDAGGMSEVEILAAAREVIRERGVNGTRIADVAERVGTSPPAVLYYFESKEELLREALTDVEDRFYAELQSELTRIPSARDRLVWLVESTVDSGDYDAVLWIELWPQALRNEELAAEEDRSAVRLQEPLPYAARSSVTVEPTRMPAAVAGSRLPVTWWSSAYQAKKCQPPAEL
jgi:AcrR family transcriptional regulator